MKISDVVVVCLLLFHATETKFPWISQEEEPQCVIYSRFDYEVKVVQKLGVYENLFEDQKKINDEQKQRNEEQEREIGDLRTELKNIKEEIKENHSEDTKIAFFAVLSGGGQSIGSGQTIIFDDAVTNIGQAYDFYTGVFTAPKDGVYQFTATLLTSNDKEIWCHIMLNGNTVANINERGTGNRHGSGSQAVILQLKEGDRIYVKNSGAASALWGEGYSSFTGFLMQ